MRPCPGGLASLLRGGRVGEVQQRPIHRTDCTLCGGGRGGRQRWPFLIFLESFGLLIHVSESLCVSIHCQSVPGVSGGPYDCRLRVNFHCWLRLGLQTSTVSPPIRALRLSRQRLLPTWRSFELDSICSHFWNGTQRDVMSLTFKILKPILQRPIYWSESFFFPPIIYLKLVWKHILVQPQCLCLPVCCHSLDSLVA